HAPSLKPAYSIFGTKLGKGLGKFFVAAGIVFDQLVRYFAGVGDIAPATARDFHFGQELGRLFQHGHFDTRMLGREIGSRKNPRRTGAYNDDMTVVHVLLDFLFEMRSEERRVGKECRSSVSARG